MVVFEAAWYDVVVLCLLERLEMLQSRFSICSFSFFSEMGFEGVARILCVLKASRLKLQNVYLSTDRKHAVVAIVEHFV